MQYEDGIGLPKNSRNRFNRLFNNEKRNLTYEIPDDEPLHTRMMYFDLKNI